MGESPPSDIVYNVTNNIPSVINNLQTVPGDQNITLSWSPPRTMEIQSFNIIFINLCPIILIVGQRLNSILQHPLRILI